MTEAILRNQFHPTMDSTTIGVVIATFSVGSLVILIWKFGYRKEHKPNIVPLPEERKGSVTNVNIAIKNGKPVSSDGGGSLTKRKIHQNGSSSRALEKSLPVLLSESSCNGQELSKSNDNNHNNNHLNVFPKPITTTTTAGITQKQAKLSRKLDEVNAQLDQLLLYKSHSETKLSILQKELNEKYSQIHQYELANRSLSEKVQELELLLKTKETKIDLLLESKKRTEVESRNTLIALETECTSLNKALQVQTSKTEEVFAAKNTLEKTVFELRSINQQQDERIKQFERERSTHESQMKQTLNEMSQELKELQAKLNVTSEMNDDAKKDRLQVVEMAQREKELRREMRQLRKSLSALFPDIKVDDKNPDGTNKEHNWVSLYVAAMKQLSGNVEDMLDGQTRKDILLSPTKKSLWNAKTNISSRSTTPHKLGSTGGDSPRTGSPTSKSGRSSRGSSYYAEKRMAEARLVESLALFCLRCLD